MIIETIPVGPLATNCYIFSEDGAGAIIIDPGAEAELIAGHLRALELQPLALVNTHGHLDHIGANAALQEYYGVPIYIGAEDQSYLGPHAEPLHRQDVLICGPEAAALFQEWYSPSPRATAVLQEGDVVPGTALTVIATPGHTPGGICLLFGDVAFVGDTLFQNSIGRSDLCGGDENALLRSIKEKLLTLPPATHILPGHGPATTVRAEKERNPFLK